MEWTFNVLDRMSDPLRAMGASADKLSKEFKKSEQDLIRFERAATLQTLAKEADPLKKQIGYLRLYQEDLLLAAAAEQKAKVHHEGFLSSLSRRTLGIETVAFAELGHMAREVGGEIFHLTEKFIELGMEASAAKGSAIRALTFIFEGDKHEAEEEFELLHEMANKTVFKHDELIDQYKQLSNYAQRYGKDAAHAVIAASADIETGPGGKAGAAAFINFMTQIEGRTKVEGRLFRQLIETHAYNQRAIGEAYAEQLGLKGPKAAEQAMKKLTDGTLAQEKAINLVFAAHKKAFREEELGAASAARAEDSLAIHIKNVKDRAEEAFEGFKKGPLLESVKALEAALDPATESGKLFADTIERAFGVVTKTMGAASKHTKELTSLLNSSIGVLSVMADQAIMLGVGLGTVLDALGSFDIKKIGKGLLDVYQAVNPFAKVAAQLGLAVASPMSKPTTQLTEESAERIRRDQERVRFEQTAGMPERTVRIGEQLEPESYASGQKAADGLIKGTIDQLQARSGEIAEAVKKNVVGQINASLDVHSPSRLTYTAGKHTGTGLGMGFRDEMRTQARTSFGSGLKLQVEHGIRASVGAGMGAGMGIGSGTSSSPHNAMAGFGPDRRMWPATSSPRYGSSQGIGIGMGAGMGVGRPGVEGLPRLGVSAGFGAIGSRFDRTPRAPLEGRLGFGALSQADVGEANRGRPLFGAEPSQRSEPVAEPKRRAGLPAITVTNNFTIEGGPGAYQAELEQLVERATRTGLVRALDGLALED
jgi:hypothetical protein